MEKISALDILEAFEQSTEADLNSLLWAAMLVSLVIYCCHWLEHGTPSGRQLLGILSPCIVYLSIAVVSYLFFFVSLVWAISDISC